MPTKHSPANMPPEQRTCEEQSRVALGEGIVRATSKLGIDMPTMARHTGLARKTIFNIEKGERVRVTTLNLLLVTLKRDGLPKETFESLRSLTLKSVGNKSEGLIVTYNDCDKYPQRLSNLVDFVRDSPPIQELLMVLMSHKIPEISAVATKLTKQFENGTGLQEFLRGKQPEGYQQAGAIALPNSKYKTVVAGLL